MSQEGELGCGWKVCVLRLGAWLASRESLPSAPHLTGLHVQRESFDVIGKVGFGRDFEASRDIDNPVNTFQLISDNLEEGIRRIFNPFRKYSRSKVTPLSLSSRQARRLRHWVLLNAVMHAPSMPNNVPHPGQRHGSSASHAKHADETMHAGQAGRRCQEQADPGDLQGSCGGVPGEAAVC